MAVGASPDPRLGPQRPVETGAPAAAGERTLPTSTGLARLVDLRFSWEAGALVVRPPLFGYAVGFAAAAIGIGVAANGVWGRTGSVGQLAFGALYLGLGLWFLLLTSRSWLTADVVGLRVGVIRRVPVPWEELEAVMVDGASRRWLMLLRFERRTGRDLRLLPVFNMRSYGRAAELRFVAKRIAIEAEHHGHHRVRWPEELTYRDRDGAPHRVT